MSKRSWLGWTFAATLLCSALTVSAQGPGGPPPKEAFVKADLFIGVQSGDLAKVRKALDAGADVNSRNWLEITPLHLAVAYGRQPMVDLLLARGAKINVGGIYGGLTQYAALGGSEDTAIRLLQRGAGAETSRVDRSTPLMVAAASGQMRLMDALLKKGAKVNAQDVSGATPLIWAARRGQTAAIERLIAAGARVAIADKFKRNALQYAAMSGYDSSVAALLRHGASVRSVDATGATALTLAARYNGDPAVLRRLVRAGAVVAHRDGHGKTAADLARARGYAAGLSVLPGGGKSAAKPSIPSERTAVARSLPAIQTGMRTFLKRAECQSCHHQGLGLMAVGVAARSGFQIDSDLMAAYGKQSEEAGKAMGPLVHAALQQPGLIRVADAVDIDDFSIGGGYLFAAPAVIGVPGNPGLSEVAALLGTFQKPQGHFTFGFNREPMQISEAMVTALNLVVIRAYGDPAASAPVVAKAQRWLEAHPGKTAEARAARLLGLTAARGDVTAAAKELAALQQADGGWAAKPGLRSDAYATGFACYALQVAGHRAASDPVVRKGLAYLRRTQDEDGSWFVNKRAAAWNNYFDAGFPHGESQYSSFAGTCWATLALLEAVKPSGLLAAR